MGRGFDMVVEECCKIIDIACRYDRIVFAANLEPAWPPTELATRLLAAHQTLPLNLEGLLEANDLQLVGEVGAIATNFDMPNRRFRNGYLPRYLRHI